MRLPRGAALAWAIGLVLALLAFGPHVVDWGTVVLGADDVDTWGTQWFYWVIGRRLLDGEPFAHTQLLFHPWGKDVYLHTGGNVFDAVLALPPRYLFGPLLGYNVFVVLVLMINGAGAVRLARAWGAGPAASMLTGALFAFNPYSLVEIAGGRPTQALLVFPCLFFASWARVLRRGRVAGGVVAGLWLALTGLTYWFYAIFAGFAAAVTVFPGLRRRGPAGLTAPLVAASVALLLAFPLAWPMLDALSGAAVPGLLDVHSWGFDGWTPRTLEGWEVGVQALDPLTLRAGFHHIDGLGVRFDPGLRVVLLVQMVVGLVGLRLGPPESRLPILCAVAVAVGLAVGPAVGAHAVNLPYVWLSWVFSPLQRLWWPIRSVGILQVLLVVPTAWLFSSGRWRGLGVAVSAFFALELYADGAVPLPVTSADVPDAYACLVDAPGAILELPYGVRPARLHFQAVHQRPRFGGMLDDNPVFAPSDHAQFRASDPMFAALSAAADARWDGASPDAGPLRGLGVTRVVVDLDRLGGGSRGRRRAVHAFDVLLGAPVYVDDAYRIYSLTDDGWRCASAEAVVGGG